MPIFVALLALIAGHALGWPAVSGYLWGNLDVLQAAQGVLHGLALVGFAGVALSFGDRLKLSLVFMAIGALALIGLLSEDLLSILAHGQGWKKDILDAAQRITLIALGLSRVQVVRTLLDRVVR